MCSNMNTGPNSGEKQWASLGSMNKRWEKKKKKTKCWIRIITELQEKRKTRNHSPSYLQAKEKELK